MKYSYCSFFQILVAKCLVLLIYSKVLDRYSKSFHDSAWNLLLGATGKRNSRPLVHWGWFITTSFPPYHQTGSAWSGWSSQWHCPATDETTPPPETRPLAVCLQTTAKGKSVQIKMEMIARCTEKRTKFNCVGWMFETIIKSNISNI